MMGGGKSETWLWRELRVEREGMKDDSVSHDMSYQGTANPRIVEDATQPPIVPPTLRRPITFAISWYHITITPEP